jgi:AcrR family transcriptional regulator
VDAIRGARERARAEITAEITAEAKRQLAVEGAGGLSLRAIARALGMVSSAVYRYVASRDELLTLLIVDAYDALGAEAERAAARTQDDPPAVRWQAVARAIRAWAVAHPHEYALVYGSPVPGYDAPGDTIGPASRVSLALVGIVVDARRAGSLAPPSALPVAVRAPLLVDLEAVRAQLDADVPVEVLVRLFAAWTQLFGLVSFELFGQTRNVIEAHEDLFDETTSLMARVIGLADS